MAGKNDKWTLFKQYMHNELGISKEDIRQWIKDAVHEEAKQLIQQGNFTAKDALQREIGNYLRGNWSSNISQDIKIQAAKILTDNIILTLKKV